MLSRECCCCCVLLHPPGQQHAQKLDQVLKLLPPRMSMWMLNRFTDPGVCINAVDSWDMVVRVVMVIFGWGRQGWYGVGGGDNRTGSQNLVHLSTVLPDAVAVASNGCCCCCCCLLLLPAAACCCFLLLLQASGWLPGWPSLARMLPGRWSATCWALGTGTARTS